MTAACCFSAVLLGSCASQEEIAMAEGVVTALPEEVTSNCIFLDNVDTGSHATIHNARFNLRLQTARLGGNLLVETHAYGLPLALRDVGVALSGRAYRCPAAHHLLKNHTELLQQRTAQLSEAAIRDMDRVRLKLDMMADGLFTL